MCELAVVIIGRNEEHHLARCIRSVFKGTRTMPGTQIVYVDSASTDRSIEIASQYPIDIVRLQNDWFLSAAAGRYAGFFQSESTFIFFIDGDSVVFKGWLERGIHFLKQHPQVAAVAGIVHENMLDKDGRIENILQNRYGQKKDREDVLTLGGIALYRREVLEQSGPFNPFITVDEERELALRIRRLGFGLVRILEPMAITYGPSRESVREILRRFHTNLYTFGRTLRYCQAEGLFWQYIRERLNFITTTLFGLLMCLLFVCVAVYLRREIWLLILCGVIVLIFFLIKRNRVHEIGTSLLKRLVMTFRTVQTYFTTRPIHMENYPKNVLVIQRQKPAGKE